MDRKEPQLKATRVRGVDIRSLPLGPEEAFVFSRVEQSSTASEVALTTGLSKEAVVRAYNRLCQLGALTLQDENGKPVVPPPAPKVPARAPVSPTAPASAPLYPAQELDEAVALAPARKRQILDWFYGADLLTHYELFGLSPEASKKEIKEAYYEVVRVFHPDRYFGKDLGAFKAKLERAFQRLTEAHEVLTRQRTRDEYDLQLKRRAPLSSSKQAQRSEVAGRISEYFEQLHSRPTLDAIAGGKLDSSPPPSGRTPSGNPVVTRKRVPVLITPVPGRAQTRTRRSSPRPPPPSGSDRPSFRSTRPPPPANEDERKQQLAAKFAGSGPGSSGPGSGARRYLTMADEALAAGDPVTAVNALRLALNIEPDAPAVALRLANAEKQAAIKMAAHNLTLARSEEAKQHYEAAADLYAKVGLGKPTPEVFERAAACLLALKKDLRRAVDFAKQATTLAPDRADLRVFLAKIYIEANMKQSALSELERAAKLSPSDATIKDFLRKLKRADS
ncbi:MAG TPA: DnaJ domain-containing protein [Polyangiaceae bacterium]|nr:DnaJ domain-containing protein [Polyangiaceae bacterium]